MLRGSIDDGFPSDFDKQYYTAGVFEKWETLVKIEKLLKTVTGYGCLNSVLDSVILKDVKERSLLIFVIFVG